MVWDSVTFLSFVMLVFIVLRKLLFGDPVAGWASTICIVMFIGGVQTFCIGILGQYMAKIYMETKHRPHYIISEMNKQKKTGESIHEQANKQGIP